LVCWFITAAVAQKLEPTFRRYAHAANVSPFRQQNRSIDTALHEIARLPADLALWSITSGHCSCDLVATRTPIPNARGPARTQHSKESGTAKFKLRSNVLELLARLAELGKPVAFVVHTYSGPLDEEFAIATGPRMTPSELLADPDLPYDAVCVVRAIPTG
jgi:hypothetical protein